LVDICEVSVHRLFCPPGAEQSLNRPSASHSLSVSRHPAGARHQNFATTCLCPALTSGVKLTHPGDALGQIVLLCTRYIIGRIPGAAFAPRVVFLWCKTGAAASALALSVFQLPPAKDNASSQLPTLHLISLVLKLQHYWFYLFILWSSFKCPSIQCPLE